MVLHQHCPAAGPRIGTIQVALQNQAEAIIRKILASARHKLQETQKEVSRDITPRVQEEMSQAYETATQERGEGTDRRQKAAVNSFVQQHAGSGSLFAGVVEALGSTLDGALLELNVALRKLAPRIVENLKEAMEPILRFQQTENDQSALREHLHRVVMPKRTQLIGLCSRLELGGEPSSALWVDESVSDVEVLDGDEVSSAEWSEDAESLSDSEVFHPCTTQHKLDKDDSLLGSECSICKEVFKRKHVAVRLPCLHAFHATCAKQWLQSKSVCPVCRHDVRRAGPKGSGLEDEDGDAGEDNEEDGEEDADEEAETSKPR